MTEPKSDAAKLEAIEKFFWVAIRLFGIAGILFLFLTLCLVIALVFYPDMSSTSWTRLKDTATVAGSVMTLVVAALGGFLVQEPIKLKQETDLKTLGNYIRGMGGRRGIRPDDDPIPEDVKDVLRRRGMM